MALIRTRKMRKMRMSLPIRSLKAAVTGFPNANSPILITEITCLLSSKRK